LQSQHINLSWCRLNVDTVSIRKNPDFSSGVATVRAISPITVYSTLMAANGSKKTYYYHPQEKEFSEQIRNNLYKKATLLNVDIGSAKFSIEPLRVRNTDLKTVYYHNFIIQGWLGQYLLKGTSQLLDIAYDTGLGAKNAQGFGMIDVIPNR
jgi:CRISPR-associated endoribonuclease Cas6